MTDQPSMWQRSTTRRFLKWLFSWRTARRALIGLACLVTLWALFCAEENIRGRRTWSRYRREMEARGEQLDFKAFIPKPVPDEQNFAATPLINSWFPKLKPEAWQDYFRRAEVKARKVESHRSMMDLVWWANAFSETNSIQGQGRSRSRQPRLSPDDVTDTAVAPGQLDPASRAKAAPAVLEALKADEAIFAELSAVSSRQYSRYPVNYDVEDPFSILLPHVSSVRNVCRRLQLKACAELAIGRSSEALEDVKLIFRLIDSLKEEPFIISYLVRIACLQHALQPVWEGLAEHRWSDAQLHELQTRLQQFNFVADFKRPLQMERAAGIVIVDLIRKRGLGYLNDLGDTPAATPSDKKVANTLGILVPSGWLYLEQYNLCHAYQKLMDGTLDPSQRRVFPDRTDANVRDLDISLSGNKFAAVFIHHRVLAGMLLPPFDRILIRAGIAQTVVNQTAIACALERYRLANESFPDKLDALVPAFIAQLPNDVITGQPYKYRRTDDGRFLLYSVGWNEKDDGGVTGKTDFDDKEGDWIWQYPARQ